MCTRPTEITYFSEYYHKNITTCVPCGKCPECIEKYQQDWSYRVAFETRKWPHCYFLTLTYRQNSLTWITLENIEDDKLDYIKHRVDALPASNDLSRARMRMTVYDDYLRPANIEDGILVPEINRKDFTDWFKSCRMRVFRELGKEKSRMKYFGCSEYGPATLRPHFHLILMCNLEPWEVVKYFESSWESKYGNFDWTRKELVRNNDGCDVSAYVAKYSTKPAAIENPYVVAGLVSKPFRMISKGIGLGMLDEYFKGFNFQVFEDYLTQFEHYKSSCRDYEFDFLPHPFGLYQNGHFGWQGRILGFSSEFLDYIIDKYLHFYHYDKQKQEVFKVTMPRYIRNKGLCPSKSAESVRTRKFTGIRSDGRTDVVACVVDVKRPNTETRLQLACKERLHLLAAELYDRQFHELQAYHPTWSDDEIHTQLLRSNWATLWEREKKSYKRLIDFYSKSKF